MKESSYWESHYQSGGVSGERSIGEYREWKWEIISKHCSSVNHVIDVGCGDNSFWQGRDCSEYLGIDISETIVQKNRQCRPGWKYIIAPAEDTQQISAPVVFCMDMLFQIMDDHTYEMILNNLAKYTQKSLFIYTWLNNPFTDVKIKRYIRKEYFIKRGHFVKYLHSFFNDIESDGIYQHFRTFLLYKNIFSEAGLKLVDINKYPGDDFGALFIFKKEK